MESGGEIVKAESGHGRGVFDAIKRINQHGKEYWSARELGAGLGYRDWRNFRKTIDKAVTSCRASGNEPEHHFVDVTNPKTTGKGAVQSVEDVNLSRFACYLIAQNGQPSKPQIAAAQKYFAIQTRRQELSDEYAADLERLEMREHTSEAFKALSGAARQSGVQSNMFGVFHDEGYKGLYGGRGNEAIKQIKGIPAAENLMDRMGTTELAANSFRLTQARDKLNETGCHDQARAIQINREVGREVRAAIANIGGKMPENLPAEVHIKQVKKKLKNAPRKLRLEAPDAAGLTGLTIDDI
jgi:DNA-damage-inducible protein D